MALIGFGYAGRVFHGPLISATPGLTLTVIASRRDRGAGSIYPGAVLVSDAISAIRHPGVDLVVVATPNDTHAALAEAALEAGKHVVVDKPFTITAAEARALTAAAAAAGRVLSVFQNRRWDSDFLGIRREVVAGRIGEVVEVRSEMSRHRPTIRDRWRERAGPGSGVWYDLGPHLIDQALLLLGPPDSLYADLQVQRTGGEAVDWFHAVLGYASARVILSSSMLAAESPARFLVRGTKGSLIKRHGDVQEEQLARGLEPGSPGWGRDPDPLVFVAGEEESPAELPAPAGDYLEYYAAIRDAVRRDGEPPVTPAQAVEVMDLIEAGIRSSAEGRMVGLGPAARHVVD
ncbi:oxidoreductase [soil metagenome]